MIYSYYVVVPHKLQDEEHSPSSLLPVLHYKKVFDSPWFFPSYRFKQLLIRNGWGNVIKNNVQKERHCHCSTHELLGILRGKMRMKIGRHQGIELILSKGDIVILPAGVEYHNLQTTEYFKCIGAGPANTDSELDFVGASGSLQTDLNIQTLKIPKRDPITGDTGKLHEFWMTDYYAFGVEK